MGRPMPGWDVQLLDEDEHPVAQGERGEICLRARSNPHYPLGYWRNAGGLRGDLRRRLVPLQGRRHAGRGRLHLVRRARRRRHHRRRLPHRAVRGRVGLPGARGRARGGGRRLARRDQGQRRQGVHRPRRGPRALRRAGRGHPALRARAPVGLRLPAPDRVRRRPAQDADGQDPPHRAARARAVGRHARRPSARITNSPRGCSKCSAMPERGPHPCQRVAPYLEALRSFAARGPRRAMVPGHKGGLAADGGLRDALGEGALALDLPTLIEGVDVASARRASPRTRPRGGWRPRRGAPGGRGS